MLCRERRKNGSVGGRGGEIKFSGIIHSRVQCWYAVKYELRRPACIKSSFGPPYAATTNSKRGDVIVIEKMDEPLRLRRRFDLVFFNEFDLISRVRSRCNRARLSQWLSSGKIVALDDYKLMWRNKQNFVTVTNRQCCSIKYGTQNMP